MNNYQYRRIFVIVADSLGVGELPDAGKYGDTGANTLGHIAQYATSFKIPVLESLGIGHICPSDRIKKVASPKATVTKLQEVSVGKDTLTGHFELMGLEVLTPFPSFTETGFPQELIDKIAAFSKRPVIGNINASGTEIIKELGEEQMRTALIVTFRGFGFANCGARRSDSRFRNCIRFALMPEKITMENEWMVGRIIARPYVSEPMLPTYENRQPA